MKKVIATKNAPAAIGPYSQWPPAAPGRGSLQIRLILRDLLPDSNELIHDLVVILHDLIHHHRIAQQIGKIAGGNKMDQ